MIYEEFRENFKNDLQTALSDKGLDVKIQENRMEKLNESYDALCITPDGGRIGVNLNQEVAYRAYENGTSYDDVVARAADSVEENLRNTPQIDIESLTDYSVMKDKLSMEVVSADRNAEMLENVPHKQMEDMAIVYRLVLDKENYGNGTILVTNNIMEQFGVTAEQLHADAMSNAPEIRPSEIKGMSEVLCEMMGQEVIPVMEPSEEQIFVASVPDKNHGAGVIAYPDFMDNAAIKLGGDFYVLPSSLHEVLLVRDDGNMTSEQLEAMVRDVNATQVAPEDRLTDHVYHYDSKEHVFELADKFEARQAEREVEEHGAEKGSVLSALKANKEKTAREAAERHMKEAVNKSRGGAEL